MASAGSADVVLGVRPEDLRVLTSEAELATCAGHIRGNVFASELTGDSAWVTLEIGSARLTAKADKGFAAAIGSPLMLGVDAVTCHLFDAKSGARLERAR